MTAAARAIVLGAIAAKHTITITYRHPRKGGGIVTRFVQPYELSRNKAGRPVLWGTDSLHGPKQIHSFRVDRIASVRASRRPRSFRPTMMVMKHLVTYDYGEQPQPQRQLRRA